MESSEEISGREPGTSVLWIALPPWVDPSPAVEFVESLGLTALEIHPSQRDPEFPDNASGVNASLTQFQRELLLFFGAPREPSFLDFSSLPDAIAGKLHSIATAELKSVSDEFPLAILDPWSPFTLDFWSTLVDRTAVLLWLTPPVTGHENESGAQSRADSEGRWVAYWKAVIEAVKARPVITVDAAAMEMSRDRLVAKASHELHGMGFEGVVDVSNPDLRTFDDAAEPDATGDSEGDSHGAQLYRRLLAGDLPACTNDEAVQASTPVLRYDPESLSRELPEFLALQRHADGHRKRRRTNSEEVYDYWSRRFRDFRREVRLGLTEERNAIALSRRRLTRLSEKLRSRASELKTRNRDLYRLSRNPVYRWASFLLGSKKDDKGNPLDRIETFLETERLTKSTLQDVEDAEMEVDELSIRNGSSPVNALIWRWKAYGSRNVARLGYLRSCTGAPSLRSTPTEEELEMTPEPEDVDTWLRENRMLHSRPRISLLVPIHATPPEVLLAMFQSVFDQVYDNWELCLAVDGATEGESARLIAELQERYPEKIRSISVDGVPGIVAGSNAAAELATGEFIGLLDHDDVLSPGALLQVALCAEISPEVDLIYSDEDKLTPEGKIDHPYFKPDFSPELLDSFNYITHFTVIRRSLFDRVGRFREGFDGSQDYDLILRVSEQARRVEHIPRILYHWRMVEGSTAADIRAKGDPWRPASFRALQDAVRRRGEDAVVEAGRAPDTYRVRYAVDPDAPVTVIIPTKDNVEMLRDCVESIHELTAHRAFEILVISNNAERPEAIAYLEEASSRGELRFLRRDIPFNYSALNNFGASQTDRPYLLFLNDDTKVISPEWMSAMLEHAQRPSIGVVGARLLFEDRTVQHGGLIVGCGGIADHAFRGAGEHAPGYFNNLRTVRNCGAVTGACMMIRRELYEQVGGMDEALAVAFNDVEFCIRVNQAGYRNVFTPYAELFHFESKSRGYVDTDEKRRRQNREAEHVRDVWGERVFHDPYYNPNLTLVRNDYTGKTPWDREIELTFRLREKVFA